MSQIKVAWYVTRVKNMHLGSPSDPSQTTAAEAKPSTYHISQKRKYMVFETCGYGSGVGGTGLMWIDCRSFIFDFERGNFEQFNL